MNAGIYHLKKETLKELPAVGDIRKKHYFQIMQKKKNYLQ